MTWQLSKTRLHDTLQDRLDQLAGRLGTTEGRLGQLESERDRRSDS